MIEHFPIEVHSVSELLSDIFVWLLFELMIWAAVLLSSERHWPLLAAALTRLEHGFNSLARHRVRVVAAIFVLVFAGRLALLPIVPVPPPRITDEFSQQLAADTFASGRVTNPTHPMSFYFETFYVNQKPSYHSMYPPATGLFMAAAQVLTGQSWYGMLFTIAAAAAAICWMLQGWVAPRWALWGAMLFVLLVAKNRMTEFYFGEGIVILGGALVLGAMPRIIKRHSVGASFCLGIGLALLAASRPYEGCLLAAGLCLGASVWAWKSGMRWPMLLRKVALPVAVILVPVFIWVAYLNWRTTGSPWLPPYELNLVQQHITRPLVWQKPVEPPHYDHPVMAAHYEQWEWNWWKSTQGFPRGVARFLADKVYAMYAWVLWPLALVTGVGSYQLLKSGIRRFLPLALFAFLAGLSIETYQLQGRYVATAWGLFLLLAVYGARYIGTWKRSTRQGRRIANAAMIIIPLALLIGEARYFSFKPHISYYDARQQLAQGLESLPGKQLVIVRYSPAHVPDEEWVYNRADIDAAKVVWARDVSDRGNERLLRYFADRTVWLLEPDGEVLRLMPYFAHGAGTNVSQVGPFPVSCRVTCEELKTASSLVGDEMLRISRSRVGH